ncbi:TetR/AcrR family transcriptional regulator [Neorhizobium sp. P12A]|uniref:TetR family transcriptional regulator n=1 Tax=Neorhizobium sp. P12A TaxID=2268027 RepID=UPI0011EF3BAB|nr:TetR family transcriptional regulator [Neorhizobium sp. P12A]KAA0692001.1 TetR/AcrR family transcriptional regulator [Neorhizobium sp. P12A]
MTGRLKPRISTRKEPKQNRSNELVSAILTAAVRVLEEEGAQRFTTARVAEKAGVSVGSLYQYFPNKASILFRLQSDEWRGSTEILRLTLTSNASPKDRLRRLVHVFVRSECDEAPVRRALADAAPLYRDAPEARALRAEGDRIFDSFILDLLPGIADAARGVAGDLIITTLTAVGKEFSEKPRTEKEIDAYAGAMADMFCEYVDRLTRG